MFVCFYLIVIYLCWYTLLLYLNNNQFFARTIKGIIMLKPLWFILIEINIVVHGREWVDILTHNRHDSFWFWLRINIMSYRNYGIYIAYILSLVLKFIYVIKVIFITNYWISGRMLEYSVILLKLEYSVILFMESYFE